MSRFFKNAGDSMRNPGRLLFVILCGALVLRTAVALGVQRYLDQQPQRQFLIQGDAWGYWELGKKLTAGEPYSLYTPPRRVLRMPGFPLLLAMTMTVAGDNPLAARLVLAAVGAVACWFVYLLGRQLFDRAVGIVAAAIAAIMPTFCGFSVLILSETAFAAALVLSLWCMARLVTRYGRGAARRETVLGALAIGLSVGLACYVRPSWLLAGPVFAVALLWCLSRSPKNAQNVAGTPVGLAHSWKLSVLVLIGLAVAMAPWVIRNYCVTDGKLVVTTLWLGPSLYDGFNPEATGDSNMEFYDRDNLLGSMSEYDVNRHYTRQALAYAASHPRRALQLCWAKLWRFWKPWPNAAQFRNAWMIAAVVVFSVPLMVLAALGAWTARRRTWALLLTLGPIVYFSLLHMAFVGSLRYRLPAEYPLCVLAAAGLLSLFANHPPVDGHHDHGRDGWDLKNAEGSFGRLARL